MRGPRSLSNRATSHLAAWVQGLLLLCAFGIVAAGALTALPASAQSATFGQVAVEKAFLGISFERPVFLTHAGDDTNRIFVVAQEGRIYVFPNDRSVTGAAVFLDIRPKVLRQGNEEGLLGLAFAPDYARSGTFYIYYSTGNPGSSDNPRRTVLSRVRVSGQDPDRADPSTEQVLLEVGQPYSNHKGGMLAFGPDGYLYLGLGDGGSGGDPHGNGQDLGELLGSILRLDVSRTESGRAYAIPPDNPFVGRQGARGEVWAYGLRNPWRFSFDSATGDLWAGDVGQNQYEEVDIIRRGGNYGWNIMEGMHCYRSPSCDTTGLVLPVVEYPTGEGCAVTGGYVYHGRRAPALEGVYVYADFCSGRIWGLRYTNGKVAEIARLADTDLQIPSFGLDQDGEMYILSFDGYIYRFVGAERLTATVPPATPTSAATSRPAVTATPAVAGTLAPTGEPTKTPRAQPGIDTTPLVPTDTPPPGEGASASGGTPLAIALGMTVLAGGALWLAFRLIRS